MRGAAAHTLRFRGDHKCTDDLGMIRKPEVIVAAEVDEARAWHPPARAFEVALFEVGERCLQRCRVALHAEPGRGAGCEQPGPCTWPAGSSVGSPAAARAARPGGTSGSIPSRASSARSRATSG